MANQSIFDAISRFFATETTEKLNMGEQDQAKIRLKLAKLELEHEDIKKAIAALQAQKEDLLTIQRFKKKKLTLKDEINVLHSLVVPDIIA